MVLLPFISQSPVMARVFISIGSNLGDRVENCSRAIGLLAGSPGVEVLRRSSFYETEPWGRVDQPPFVNCVIEVSTELSPAGLLALLKEVEEKCGREGRERWGPREVDLDIVFFSDIILSEEGLTIPHPSVHERAFVLVPLSEIAPDFIHPVLKKSVSDLIRSLKEGGRVRKMEREG